MKPGVTFIVCCHNSAQRLPRTLTALRRQRGAESIPWEVVLVDNASVDGTAETARSLWREPEPAALRVVHEPVLGQARARRTGLAHAAYAFVSFIDDDNAPAEDWVATLFALMSGHPEIGLCGSQNVAVFEQEPPEWFDGLQSEYAVGLQGERAGFLPDSRWYVWGAGLSLRTEELRRILDLGYTPALRGRTGELRLSGDDSEIALMMRLAGWRPWYEPRLVLEHFLPAPRLQWSTLRRTMRGFGAADIVLGDYRCWLQLDLPNSSRWWPLECCRITTRLMRALLLLDGSVPSRRAGSRAALRVDFALGKLTESFRSRRKRRRTFDAIGELQRQLRSTDAVPANVTPTQSGYSASE